MEELKLKPDEPTITAVHQEQQQHQELESLRGSIELNPFILVLIDGNEIKFPDPFVHQGREGGSAAVKALIHGIKRQLRDYFKERPDIRILIQIQADTLELSNSYLQAGTTNNHYEFIDFVRGCNENHNFLDFADVGHKNIVNSRIADKLMLYRSNVHCIHIILGTYESEIYETVLGDIKLTDRANEQITLLKAKRSPIPLPASADKFETAYFENYFIETPATTSQENEHTTPPVRSIMERGVLSKANKKRRMCFNSAGQRVDIRVQYNNDVVKEMRYRGICASDAITKCTRQGCPYEHDANLTIDERNAVMILARSRPCTSIMCRAINCVHGHQCRFNRHCSNERCRFPADMHNIDTEIVDEIVE